MQGILGSYLNNVLERQMAPGQREVARQLLEKLAASEPEMRLSKGALAELLHGDAIDRTTTDEVLKQLQDAFLVRMEVVDGHETVELAHRYLLNQLKPDKETKEVVAAKKLLERWVQEYDEQGMLLDADRLAIIETQWDKLGVADDSKAAELRKKSADRLARQRDAVHLGIGGALVLVVLAVASIVAWGAARTDLGHVQATSTVVTQKQQVAETAAIQSVAIARVAETVAADALATQATAEAAASNAEARAEVAAATLRRAFEQTGVVPVGKGPTRWPGMVTSLWVANGGDDTVQQIDPSTGAVAATIKVDQLPSDLAWVNGSIWVATDQRNSTNQPSDK